MTVQANARSLNRTLLNQYSKKGLKYLGGLEGSIIIIRFGPIL